MSSSTLTLRLLGACGRSQSHFSRSEQRICIQSKQTIRVPLPLIGRRSIFSQSSTRKAQPATSPASSSPPSPPAQQPPKSAQSSTSTTSTVDDPIKLQEDDPTHVDWTKSFHGLSVQPFSKEAADVLLAPINPEDVEIKPDGIIYLPEIKYRRILNRAFGPGGWGLAPRGETIVTERAVTREYALLAHGR